MAKAPENNHSIAGSGLGKGTAYVSQYDPKQLYPIARSVAREALALNGELPFVGCDLWTGWELSWLDSNGLPQVAVAEFEIPVASTHIIESKSFKLYLNSFNQSRFNAWADVEQALIRDLSEAAGGPVDVRLMTLADARVFFSSAAFDEQAICLDHQAIAINDYHPKPELLSWAQGSEQTVTESLYSDLLKSNCPVTGQPDWASIWICYTGRAIDRAALLAYIVSFREHQGFHEQCVERCFLDIWQRLQPQQLAVYARYTRRGGLDINPYRASSEQALAQGLRLVRQ